MPVLTLKGKPILWPKLGKCVEEDVRVFLASGVSTWQ